MTGNRYGAHRVIEPIGSLPQAALKLDNTPEICDSEILIDVNTLNITSAAFHHLKQENNGDKKKIAESILEIVRERGKFQCPVTGSGGMLIGSVEQIGKSLEGKVNLTIGQNIATMVSLSLTPLYIEEILEIDTSTDQVFIRGKAILFESGIWADIPPDLSDTLCLAVMDVAGAPAWTAKYVIAGNNVAIFGAGKAGLLCLYEAKKRVGPTGMVIAVDASKKQCEIVRKLGLADHILNMDAKSPMPIFEEIEKLTGGRMCDFVVNVVNVPATEMVSILACRDFGTVLFFSMATSFTRVALGCEGIGKELTLLVGTGYTKGHDRITYQILRDCPALKDYFEDIYGG